jgi:hypothetical protein
MTNQELAIQTAITTGTEILKWKRELEDATLAEDIVQISALFDKVDDQWQSLWSVHQEATITIAPDSDLIDFAADAEAALEDETGFGPDLATFIVSYRNALKTLNRKGGQ